MKHWNPCTTAIDVSGDNKEIPMAVIELKQKQNEKYPSISISHWRQKPHTLCPLRQGQFASWSKEMESWDDDCWDHLEINKNVWERNEKCWQNNFSIWILSEYISQHALFSAKKASDTTTSNTTTTTICKMAKTFPRWTKIKQKHWSSMSNSLSSLCYTIIYSVFKSSCLKKP